MWTLGLKGLTRRVYFVKSTPIMESFILPDERNFKKIQLEVFDSILIFFSILFFSVGKCELSEHYSCFSDVWSQTWTSPSLSHGEIFIVFGCNC